MMLEGINYSEADAEFDSQLVFQEVEDLDALTFMGNNLICGREANSEKKIHHAVANHLRNVRYAKFAQEALRTEFNNLVAGDDNIQSTKDPVLSAAEYKHRLQTVNRVYAVEVPNVQQMISEAGLLKVEASMKQLKKDIERDRLVVNGLRMVGAEAGLDAILAKISTICDDVHKECGVPVLGEEVKEFAVLSLLSKASRSHSGGIAFQAAQNLIDPATTMLMPQSAVAPPLKINIHLGAFPATRSECLKEAATDTENIDPSQKPSCHAANGLDIPSSSSGPSKHSPSVDAAPGLHHEACGGRRWGLVCKITGESIFKVQLYDSPVDDGYDDCSTGDLEGGEDGSPCLFRPVTVPSGKVRPSGSASNLGVTPTGASPLLVATDGTETSTTKRKSSGSTEESTETGESDADPSGAAQSPVPAPESEPLMGVSLEGRNTFVSVIYEDYVLFEVRLTPAGELSNLEHLRDNWKETATVTIREIEPVRTLM